MSRKVRLIACTAAAAATVAVLSSCANSTTHEQRASTPSTTVPTAPQTSSSTPPESVVPANDRGIYAFTGATDIAAAVKQDAPLVYVPNSEAATVDVIDPRTFAVVRHFKVGKLPQHVTPSWDLRTLYVDNDLGNSLTPIDARTGLPGSPISVDDPYNLYFTPDGTRAIVVAERLRRLDIRDPKTWHVIKRIPTPCVGVDHADFSADGAQMVLSCEFSGDLIQVNLKSLTVTATLHLGGQPVDVKLSPDGSVFYVANWKRNGVSVVDAATFTERKFIPTGAGAHGLYPSRNARWLYVTNRRAGSVSVLDFTTGTVHATWSVGGSPDMGGVTADGTQLWLSGRYDGNVKVIDTATGKVLHTIAVGSGPHGLCVWPQPGRYSLGHTGNLR